MYMSNLNYEYAETKLYKETTWLDFSKFWEERKIISFENINGRPVYIIGVESKISEGETFVKVDMDGFPEELIGGIDSLTDLMENNYVTIFDLYEF